MNGLVLTGGGARGAYQAGVLQGIAAIAGKRDGQMPFRIVTGTSAGAINAAFLAATADQFSVAAPQLADFWSQLRSHDIFRTDLAALGRIGYQWLSDILFGDLRKNKTARSLLDTQPLRGLIAKYIPFERIAVNLDNDIIHAFEIAATDYQSSENVSFIMSRDPNAGWQRQRRHSQHTQIGLDHVLASSAIPVLFPPVKIGDCYFGDGCLRNSSPLSPAIHLGANRLLIISVRQPRSAAEASRQPHADPTIGRVFSVLLNAMLMDGVEFDLERLSRINDTLKVIPEDRRHEVPLRIVDCLTIAPSVDLGLFATSQFSQFPESIRHLISGLGSREEASELISYLLFEPDYCGYLTNLGRQDALARQDEIEAFLYGR